MTRITLEIDADELASMNKLRDHVGARDHAEMLSRALAVYEFLHRRKVEGAEILTRDSDGEYEMELR